MFFEVFQKDTAVEVTHEVHGLAKILAISLALRLEIFFWSNLVEFGRIYPGDSNFTPENIFWFNLV